MAVLPLQLARVSNTLRTNVANQSITRSQQMMLQVQNQLSSGKKISAPSEDPGAASIIQQLTKTLAQRQTYSANLQQASSQLGEVDSTMSDMIDLLRQAGTLASSNVGTDVTADQRSASSVVASSIYNQMLSLANKQSGGVYIFGGDRANASPFVEEAGGVRFAGSDQVLKNSYDENVSLPFMVNGSQLFGATSSQVQGTADLSPALWNEARLSDMNGANDKGIRLGSIRIGNGTTSAVVDLSGAESIGNVVDAINNAGVGGIHASLNGGALQISGDPTDNITIEEVGGGPTAADLGILTPTAGGAGVAINGNDIGLRITALTPLDQLRNGAGFDRASGLKITNGANTASINFIAGGAKATVQDFLNSINGADTGVQASINADGTGLNLVNTVQGSVMTIGENGGTTATDLGVRSWGPETPLSQLNFGKGVQTVTGADIQISLADNTSFTVDLSNAKTVQDVMDAINTASGGKVDAAFASTGNGITLTDHTVGAGQLVVSAQNYSTAAADLGLLNPSSGGVVAGKDVGGIQASGMFSNLMKLRDALQKNDQAGITAAAGGLENDLARVIQMQGETGARIQELTARQNRLDDQDVATKALLSSVQDTDFNDAITRFQSLQITLQATLQASGKTLNLSLLDFLQ